jgi:hypothetical protein
MTNFFVTEKWNIRKIFHGIYKEWPFATLNVEELISLICVLNNKCENGKWIKEDYGKLQCQSFETTIMYPLVD